jgi:exportin-T
VGTGPLDESVRTFLASLLRVLLDKLKWDEEADLEDVDEEDNAEFERLRKVSDVNEVHPSCGDPLV